jgi:nucleoside-diphosphate-sugar epimerase
MQKLIDEQENRMHILVAGATGFVGFWLTRELIEKGYKVTCAVKNTNQAKQMFPEAAIIFCDFAEEQSESYWQEQLKEVDVIVNCIGLFYHSEKSILWRVHLHTPKVIFTVANQLKLKKVIQLSALGIEQYNTAYAQSKLAAEQFLQENIQIPYFILKPSFIYGPGSKGGILLLNSLAMFIGKIPLPGNGGQLFQPIFVFDLVKSMLSLIQHAGDLSETIHCVSKDKISLKTMLQELARWMGRKRISFLPVPQRFLQLGAYLGSILRSPLINKESVQMLQAGCSTSEEKEKQFTKLCKLQPLSFSQGINYFPVTEAIKWQAKLFFIPSLLRFALAITWIFGGVTGALFFKETSYSLLASLGLPDFLQMISLYGSSLIDIFIGLSLLFNIKIKQNCIAQLIVISSYTLLVTLFFPWYWLEPFGPIVKNIPIIICILILYRVTK